MDEMEKEIQEMSDVLAKAVDENEEIAAGFDDLKEIIKSMTKEELVSKVSSLSGDEASLFKSVLEGIKADNLSKGDKAVTFDDVYQDKMIQGKYTDTIIQEDTVNDDQDEKLVKLKAAQHNHQGDSTPDGIEGQVIKSILSDIDGIDSFEDEELENIAKSFDFDLDLVNDYLNSEEDESEDDDSLEKSEKTVSRSGVKYYASGKNAGKKVGTIRGDKASINSIARARKKGKLSAKGAKRGIKRANEEKNRTEFLDRTNQPNPKTDQGIQNTARRQLVQRKTGFNSPEHQEKTKQHFKNMSDSSQPFRDKIKDLKGQMKNKKDGSPAKSKKNDELAAKIDQENKSANTARYEIENKFHKEARVPAGNAMRAKDASLKERRNAMKKSIDLEGEDLMKVYEMCKSSDDMMYSMLSKMSGMYNKSYIKKMCMEKGFDEGKLDSMIDRALKTHEDEMHKMAQDVPEASQVSQIEMEKASCGSEMMTKSTEVVKKAIWEDENALLKANILGRNHNFSVNQYYDEVIAKSQESDLKKSQEVKEEPNFDDLNDIISEGLDTKHEVILEKSLSEDNKSNVNGTFFKSFSDEDMAKALNLSSEELNKLLGE